MPNVVAHFGAQGLLSRIAFRKADPKWILLGCIIPDIPWILQRLNGMLGLGIDPYAMRLYAIAQASLALSLLLCGALALISAAPTRIFGLLAAGAVFHLLLDAIETKWGNGVHLFAPFLWRPLNLGWFWPDSAIVLGLSLLGVAFVVREWRNLARHAVGFERGGPVRMALAAALFAGYFIVPPLLAGAVQRSDSHFIGTLLRTEDRAGRPVAFDRARFSWRHGTPVVRTLAGEEIVLTGPVPAEAGSVSMKAVFVSPDTLRVLSYHSHAGSRRDLASYLGLSLMAGLWAASLLRARTGSRR